MIRFKLKQYKGEKHKLSDTVRKQWDIFRMWDLQKTTGLVSFKKVKRKKKGSTC